MSSSYEEEQLISNDFWLNEVLFLFEYHIKFRNTDWIVYITNIVHKLEKGNILTEIIENFKCYFFL